MPPLSLMIKPASSSCNMRCKYCFYADEAQTRETGNYGVMTERTLENLVCRAFAYAEGEVSFAFQGGEPTLAGLAFYRRAVQLQQRYARGVRVHNAIQTNGLDLSDEMLDFFAEQRFLVGVSLDGIRSVHDAFRLDAQGRATYDRVRSTLARMKKRGISYNILCVVGHSAAQHGRDILQALRSERYIQFIPRLDAFDCAKDEDSLTAEDYTRFLKETFDVYYHALKSGKPISVRCFDNYLGMLMGWEPENCAMRGQCGIYYLIEADGGVYPCDFYALDSWRMGNINEDSFFRLAKSPVGRAFRSRSMELAQECLQCPWRFLCRGGCPRERAPFPGDEGIGKYRFCESSKAFFPYALDRMRELAVLHANNRF